MEEIDELSLQTWSVLDRLARAVHVTDGNLQATLDAIVSNAVSTVGVAEDAGLILVDKGVLVPQAVTGEPPKILDFFQQAQGAGPCIDAAEQQTVIRIEDTADDARWPEFCVHAASLGVGGMLCVPLWIDERILGALSLYAPDKGQFDDRHAQLAQLYATHAALALADAQRTEQLRTALQNRDLIGQAKGILIERSRLTPDAAFRCLSLASQATNLKLTAVAQHLVDTGELLGAAPQH
jgi:GAF domain-containing protein